MKVVELLGPDQSWNKDILPLYFGNDLTNAIVQVPSGQPGDFHDDHLELLFQLSGSSITAHAYTRKFANLPAYDNWFRKLHLHPRESIFWWRVGKGAIPTAEWLYRRGLSVSNLCPWGCGDIEDRDHVTAKCKILHKFTVLLARWGFSMPNLSSFSKLSSTLRKTQPASRGLARVYCNTVYQIWRARNAMRH